MRPENYISSLQTVSSAVFRTRVSLQRLSGLVTQRCHTDLWTPRYLGNAFCSQVMCTSICYQVSMFSVYKQRHKSWGELYVQSLFWLFILDFKTQRITVELRTGHTALAIPHLLHQYRNRFRHQLQLKLPMWIPSPFCNSNRLD